MIVVVKIARDFFNTRLWCCLRRWLFYTILALILRSNDENRKGNEIFFLVRKGNEIPTDGRQLHSRTPGPLDLTLNPDRTHFTSRVHWGALNLIKVSLIVDYD